MSKLMLFMFDKSSNKGTNTLYQIVCVCVCVCMYVVHLIYSMRLCLCIFLPGNFFFFFALALHNVSLFMMKNKSTIS